MTFFSVSLAGNLASRKAANQRSKVANAVAKPAP